MKTLEELVDYLKPIAEKHIATDNEDFIAIDYCGGNFDDAWNSGSEGGETYMARTILDKLGIEYKIEKD